MEPPLEPPLFLPAPEIKEEEEYDTCEIIDLDKDQTPEDVVYEWDLRVRIKLKPSSELCQQSLDALMRWYIQTLEEEAVNFEDTGTLLITLSKHMQFFKLYFTEINNCFVDTYLDNMEEILIFYSNMVVRSIPRKRKDGNRRAHKKLIASVCHKIISNLYAYLLHREDRVCHVVMKIKLDLHSEECKELLNLVYGNFCTKEPRDSTDLEFCRAYILCQKWKIIRDAKDWMTMDDMMYALYNRTPESLKTNDTLKQILYPQNNYVLDMFIHFSEKHIIITDAYFKFIKSKKKQEDNTIVQDISNISLHEEIIADMSDDEEHEVFNRAFSSYERTMSAICQRPTDYVKVEESDDDEPQIVSVTPLGYDAGKSDLIHEFVDDDIEMIYFKRKEDHLSVIQNTASKETDVTESSSKPFHIAFDKDVRTERVTSSTNNSPVPCKSTSADNRVSTSTSITTESVNRPKCSTFTQISSTETTAVVSAPMQKAVSTESTIRGVLSIDIDNDSRTNDTGTSVDMETATDVVSPTNLVKSVINIETQTEDFSQVVSDSDLKTCQCSDKDIEKGQEHISENHTEQDSSCGSYYCYGLVTPPSDQPRDEHSTPPTEPNVYANIVRTHNSPHDNHTIAKVSENAYLLSPAEENEPEDVTKVIPTTSVINKDTDLVPLSPVGQSVVVEQCMVSSDDDSINNFDVEFGEDDEPSTKKILSNLDNSSSMNDNVDSYESVITEAQIEHPCRDEATIEEPNLNDVGYGCVSNLNDETSALQKSMELPSNAAPSPSTDDACKSSSTSTIQTDFDDAVTSGSPNKHSDITTNSSSNIQCSSTDFNVSSDGYLLPSSNILPPQVRTKLANIPCTSPDITSTSVDIHDFQEDVSSEGDHRVYFNLEYNETVVINNPSTNNEDCCLQFEKYSEEVIEEFSNNENVSQSNLVYAQGEEQIFIQESVLINNREELLIVEEALPIATDVNIIAENHSDQLSSPNSIYSPSNETCHEIVIENEILPLITENGDVNGQTDDYPDPEKIMYTSSGNLGKPNVDDFEKFQGKLHGKWADLPEGNILDNILSGPVTKINGTHSCVNPDITFDLFSSKPSTALKERTSHTPVSSCNSSVEDISPEYEVGIDDFKTYYEESKNKSTLCTSGPPNKLIVSIQKSAIPIKDIIGTLKDHKSELKKVKKVVQLSPHSHNDSGASSHLDDAPSSPMKDLIPNKSFTETVPATSNDKQKSLVKKHPKRTRIAFAENIIQECHTSPHSTKDDSNNILQGILKKASSGRGSPWRGRKQGPCLRIPEHLMNARSLAYYNVKPNDACLQGVPCVVVEKLTDTEIAQWSRISEMSREFRLQKEKAHYVATEPACRIVYDKRSSQICDGDIVMYNTSAGVSTVSLPQALQKWRSNTNKPSKSSRLDEDLNSNDLPYTEKKTGKRKRKSSESAYNSENLKRGPGRPRKNPK